MTEDISLTTIIKRDGRQVAFDPTKIEQAIAKAAAAVPTETVDLTTVMATILQQLRAEAPTELTVEHCQDVVEQALMSHQYFEVAKSYILYRDQRTRARELKQSENKIVDELVNVDAKDNDDARENANVNADATMGALLKIGETTLKSYALRNLFSPKYVELYNKGILYIHDLALSCLTINCLFIPLGKLLRNGFSTGHGFLRPPATIGSAATLTCIVIQSSQNDMYK